MSRQKTLSRGLLAVLLIALPCIWSLASQSIQPFPITGTPINASHFWENYFLKQDPGETQLRQDVHNERIFKNELITNVLKKAKPGTIFTEEMFSKPSDAPEDPELWQGWRHEVAFAFVGKKVPRKVILEKGEDLYRHFYENTPIDIAKKIAKGMMHQSISENWDPPERLVREKKRIRLKGSTILKHDFDTLVQAKPELARELDEEFVVDPKLHFGNFLFHFPEVADVEINKTTLKSGTVFYNVNSANDMNHPPAGAENFKTDIDAGIAPLPRPSASGAADAMPTAQ